METNSRFINAITLPNYDFDIKAPEFQKEGDSFTIWFFEDILKVNSNYVECLMYLGNAYTANGMYEKGLMVDQKLSGLRPNDPTIQYNLACSYALLKDADAAIEALERAIVLGYTDIYHLERDKDLALLRKDARFRKLIEKMKTR